MTTFTTINDVISAITPVFGDFASDYDLEGIAREISEWQDGKLVADLDSSYVWEVSEDYCKMFQVIVCDDRENVDETYHYYGTDSYSKAVEHFEELKDGYDFGEHDALWLFESCDGGETWESVDGYTPSDRS